MRLTPSQQAALTIKKHVCVTAGAGSGKTTVLVERYLKILREARVTPREIVAITFTEKAAAEMKERIISQLSEEKESERPLAGLRDQMNTAPISTIHAFCARILREFLFQAGVPANFGIVQGIDQKLLLQQSVRETLRTIATDTDDRNRPELARLLQRYGGQQRLVDLFIRLITEHEVVAQLISEVYENPNELAARSVLQHRTDERNQQVQERLMATIDIPELIRSVNAVLELAKGKNRDAVTGVIQKLADAHTADPNSPEIPKLLKEIKPLITTAKGPIATRDFIGTKVDTTAVETEIGTVVSIATKIDDLPSFEVVGNGQRADTKTDTDDDDAFLLDTVRDLLTLHTRTLKSYETIKLSQGLLDFSDLQLKTRDLLRDHPDIRQTLIQRHRYYMIDEYQDTNELQYELVALLTDGFTAANLFIVGDPKQSIYGFRGADVRVFEKTKRELIERGGADISLTENFRSLRDPIGFINHFFDALMGAGTESEFEVAYEALTLARPVKSNGQIDILIGKKGENPINESELIANHIKKMTEKTSEARVWGRGANGAERERPIQYGDIAILIRSRRHLPDIEHALFAAGIPYIITGGVGFYQRQEIYDIWNYLDFLNAPTEKGTSLVAVLRGPAFGISDTELYEISLQSASEKEETRFWDKARQYPNPTEQLTTAIDILEGHIRLAHRMPVNRLITTIVNETGLIGTLKTGKYGQQRSANYEKLLELARNFDGDESTPILSDFIRFLDILITEEPGEGQAQVEAGSGAVQIMTIHAAKGLQFPVVILPNLDRSGQRDMEPFIDDRFGIGFKPLRPEKEYVKTEPEIIIQMKDRSNEKANAEKKRLFYVGTTRAQDRLILSGTLTDKGKSKEILEWLYKHLDLNAEEDSRSLAVAQDIFTENGTNREQFQIQIPIYQGYTRDELADTDADETVPTEFPEAPPPVLESTEIPASFSVAELADYARCPLRYQLQHILQIPINDEENEGTDAPKIEAAIRYALSRIRKPSDTQNIEKIIQETSEDVHETATESAAVSESVIRTHIRNFIHSELGQLTLGAPKTRINQKIHANIEGHILYGGLDRLFVDSVGQWQPLNYETGTRQVSESYTPEMELYGLLVLSRYPEQARVTVNLCFTDQDASEQREFSRPELAALTTRCLETISRLQRDIYDKNTDHCCACPYATRDGACIITES